MIKSNFLFGLNVLIGAVLFLGVAGGWDTNTMSFEDGAIKLLLGLFFIATGVTGLKVNSSEYVR